MQTQILFFLNNFLIVKSTKYTNSTTHKNTFTSNIRNLLHVFNIIWYWLKLGVKNPVQNIWEMFC